MEISRAELYKLVWSHPLTEIAKFHGVNAIRIAQACDAYDIVRPPAGYWQKLAHGKTSEKLRFESTTYPADEIVTIERRDKARYETAKEF